MREPAKMRVPWAPYVVIILTALGMSVVVVKSRKCSAPRDRQSSRFEKPESIAMMRMPICLAY